MRWLVLASVFLVGSPVWADPPCVVLIHVDDLGINDLGCHGRKDHNTPNLDRLAAQGLRFTSAYCSQPICSPSRAGLLTGKHPARLHLTTYLPGRADAPSQKILHPKIRQQLPLEETTLAEYLRQAGYATACIGKWHLGGKGFTPDRQGFDVVFAGKANTTPTEKEGGKGEFELTEHAIAFLEANRAKPFFLYLAHHAPHIPLAARQALIQKNRTAFNPVYAAVVESLDTSVGRLLTRLDELKLTDRTLVLFMSDNGGVHIPELREDAATHNTPYRAGKGFLYEGGLRVPLLVRWPGKIAPGVTEAPVVNTDLVPTILTLIGRPIPPNLDGTDVSALLLNKKLPEARTLYWHFPHYNNQGGRPGGAVREGQWKLIEYYDTETAELYDLTRDSGEGTDLAAHHPDQVKALRSKLAAWRTRMKVQTNTPNPNFDPALFRKLYVETDVSKLVPLATAAEMTPGLRAWRKTMDTVVSKR